MKPDCEKRLTVVIGGERDQCSRSATGVMLVAALGLSQRRSVDAGRGRALACAAGHRESSEAREKGRRVVASKDERIACGRISCPRLRRHCGASAGGPSWMVVRAMRCTAKVVPRDATCR